MKDSWRIEQHISQQCSGGNEVGRWVIVGTWEKSKFFLPLVEVNP